jgi:small nuclear ribonucleoprotein (snRNP)-like protein
LSAEKKGESRELEEFVGKVVVVDTSTPILYLGKLESVDNFFLTLVDCDVHDVSEGASTKELYCIEAKKHGVRINRNQVKVRKALIVSISLLEDVIEY